jgi:hypothetical protein
MAKIHFGEVERGVKFTSPNSKNLIVIPGGARLF